MVEEPSRERESVVANSFDRLMRRMDAHRSLPAIGDSDTRALGSPTAIADEGLRAREPAADVVVTPAHIFVTLELPGASRETIEVLVGGLGLSVHALTPDGRVFHADIPLSHPTEPDAVKATYRHGVLDLTLPRRHGHRFRLPPGE